MKLTKTCLCEHHNAFTVQDGLFFLMSNSFFVLEPPPEHPDKTHPVYYQRMKITENEKQQFMTSTSVKNWITAHPSYIEKIPQVIKFTKWLSQNSQYFDGITTIDDIHMIQDDLEGRKRQRLVQELILYCSQLFALSKSKENTYDTILSLLKTENWAFPAPPDPPKFRDSYRQDLPEMTLDHFLRAFRQLQGLMLQSAFLCKFQMTVGTKEFLWFSNHGWPLIKDQFMEKASTHLKDPNRLMIDVYVGRFKTGAPEFRTSIERDGLELLRQYFETERGIPQDHEAIWIKENGSPLTSSDMTKHWIQALKKAGLYDPRYGPCPECETPMRRKRRARHYIYYCPLCDYKKETKHAIKGLASNRRNRTGMGIHDATCDLPMSLMQKSNIKDWVINFRHGHVIDPNNYKRIISKDPTWGEKQYALAAPYLNILSDTPDMVPKEQYDDLVYRQQLVIDNLTARQNATEAMLRKWAKADELEKELKKEEHI